MPKLKLNGATIGGSADNAISINYDNESSGLDTSNVQEAIDEIASDVSTLNSTLGIINSNHNTITVKANFSVNGSTQTKIGDIIFPSNGLYLVIFILVLHNSTNSRVRIGHKLDSGLHFADHRGVENGSCAYRTMFFVDGNSTEFYTYLNNDNVVDAFCEYVRLK